MSQSSAACVTVKKKSLAVIQRESRIAMRKLYPCQGGKGLKWHYVCSEGYGT